ncbi:MAG TPA: MFS transporter [Bacillales bacterium]|nr:MFS transporter [Bacillales bacterium]
MNKKEIRSWALYDWANSAFATTVMAAVLPIFYHDVAAKGLDDTMATSLWGYSQSAAMVFVAVLSPILGTMADYTRSKKQYLMFFAYMGMIATMLLVFVGEGDYALASLLLIVGTIGFSGGNVFYDAFLPEISDGKHMDKVSALGFAYGYIGGGLILLLDLLMIMKPEVFGLRDTLMATHAAFATVALWWLFFSIPMFRNVKDPNDGSRTQTGKNYVRITARRLSATLQELPKYRELLKFLLAFWIYNDGISTIIKMATIYGRDIGIGQTDLIAALLITQFVGIPFAFLFGWLAGKIEAKRALLLALIVYVLIVILGFFMKTAFEFYLLAIMVGFVQGGAQSLSRSIFGRMIPKGRNAEFFGFYGISSKFAAIFGPFLFALTSQLTGSSRWGILSVALFFVIGILLLLKVNVAKGQREAAFKSSDQNTCT